MRLHHHCQGGGFPLIILHGLLGSSDNWQNISRKLAGQFQVCAPDLRNHGRSPHDETFDYDAMGDDLLELMADRQFGRAHLLGHSMGGKVAMNFALRHPEKVEKLVVVDITPRAYEPSHLPIFEALSSLDLSSFRERGEVDRALAARIKDVVVRQFLLKNLGRDEHGTLHWKPNLPVIRRKYNELNAALEVRGKFEGPALFIKGEKSDYITEADRELIARMFPNAQMAEIPEAGHWVHAEAPEKFITIVSEFLN
jgi:pimeloyl-ACP methyl ester carboxylesterase